MAIKVNLVPIGTGSYIHAPIHCPYAVMQDNGIFIVNPTLCPLCKICEFDVNIHNDTAPLESRIDPAKFVNYLSLINEKSSRSISAQLHYLNKVGRLPLTILISPVLYDSMLKLVYADNNTLYHFVYSYFLNNEKPLCHIASCPVYLSRKLTKTELQIVGEVEWK